MPLVLARNSVDEFRDQVVAEVPGFAASEQYCLLDSDDRKVPGLVFAALAAFVAAIQEEMLKGAAAPSLSAPIDRAYAIFEIMAASGDRSLQNLLVTEVFENWDHSVANDTLRGRLGPEADALYRVWIERTSN